MEHGTVTAQTRLTCVALTVAGSLLLMTGVVLALVRAVIGGWGWPLPSLAPWLLVASGLVCGGIMIAASTPAGSRLDGGRLQPGSRPARVRWVWPSRVWLSRLRYAGRPEPRTRRDGGPA